MRAILLIGLLLLAVANSALAFQTSFNDKDGSENILLIYEESGKWNFNHFIVPKGELQDLHDSRNFLSKDEAYNFLIKNFSHKFLAKKEKRSMPNEFVSTEDTGEFLWKAKNEWNLEWENKFALWVKENFDEKFFVRHELSTDCADVAFALRWIFARIHSLPAANTLAGSGVLFSNESMKKEWKDLATNTEWSKDMRFIEALNYLMLNAYTGTLRLDTYPIEISKDFFREGTIHLTQSHTRIVNAVNYDTKIEAPLTMLSSTVPSQIRVLYKEAFTDSSRTERSEGGLLRMRWPIKREGKWMLVEEQVMPGYSMEQFDDDFNGESGSFVLAIYEKLGINFRPKVIIENLITSLVEYLNARVTVVKKGYDFCLKNNCDEGTLNYEDWSTPSRDSKTKKKFQTIEKFAYEFDSAGELSEYVRESFLKSTVNVDQVTFDLETLKKKFYLSKVSSHPYDPPSERWAFSNSDVLTYFNKALDRIEIKREKKVADASVCRKDKAICSVDTDLFKELATYDLDEKIKEIYNSIMDISLEETSSNLSAFLNLKKSIQGRLFYLSDPRLEVEERNGALIDLSDFTFLPPAKEVIELRYDYFMLDKKLYHLEKGYLFEDAQDLLVNYKTASVIGVSRDKLFSVDLVSGQQKNIDIDFDQENGAYLVSWISPQIFYVSNCPSEVDYNSDSDCQVNFYNGALEKIDSLRAHGIEYFEKLLNIENDNFRAVKLLSRYFENKNVIDYKGQLKIVSGDIVAENDNSYIIANFDSNSFSLFDKETNSLNSSYQASSNFSWSVQGVSGFIIVYEGTQSTVLDFSKDSFVEVFKTNDWVSIGQNENDIYLISYATQTPELFLYKNGLFEKFNPFHGKIFGSVEGDFYLFGEFDDESSKIFFYNYKKDSVIEFGDNYQYMNSCSLFLGEYCHNVDNLFLTLNKISENTISTQIRQMIGKYEGRILMNFTFERNEGSDTQFNELKSKFLSYNALVVGQNQTILINK